MNTDLPLVVQRLRGDDGGSSPTHIGLHWRLRGESSVRGHGIGRGRPFLAGSELVQGSREAYREALDGAR